MTTTRDDLHKRIDQLKGPQLEQAAAALDEALPPGRGTTSDDVVARTRRHAAQRNPRALGAAHDQTRPPLPLISDPDVLEGQAAFAETRVPAWVLFNYLSDERAVAAFLDAYPQVRRADVLAVLDLACRALTGQDTQGDTPDSRRG
jgi:uncharacterized protein (DUF433 family)